ncbi:MAG: OmpA family protein [Spirochaetales bacterium]|nr:OmpA family protein [Spirochaetales bacterium]
MKKNLVLVVLLTIAVGIPSFAQFNPVGGAGILQDLYSPIFLAGSASSVKPLSPVGDVLNPAVSGANQRLTLDASYLALFGTAAPDNGWKGHIVNAGVSVPTRVGVFSGSARFVSSTFPSMPLGTFSAVNVSFAKDLFPTLLVGLGLQAQFGRDWGLGADLGFVHMPGDLSFMKDFRWGIALRGMGKGYDPDLNGPYSSVPEPFTPAAGVAFDVLQREKVRWGVHSDVSMPSFQNLRFGLGTELGIVDTVFFHLGTGFDIDELGNGLGRDIPLSFGLSVKLGTSVQKNRSELLTTVAAAPLANGIWGVGAGINLPIGLVDRKAPEITLSADTAYISPNLDGVQDDLVKPLGIADERYVKGYRFLIYDSTGALVRTIENKDERPENVTFKNVLARLAYVKKGISVPSELRWDGRSDLGTVVPDGTYTYKLEAWDDNDNLGESATGTVVVDNTPPAVAVSAPYLIFSPNGDGNKDVLPIAQEGSSEDRWEGQVTDAAGNLVAGFAWQYSVPPAFEWSGKNDSGVLAADGVYSYRVAATDRAGNAGSAQLDNILINTLATPINISISDAFISPNGDGIKDSVRFELQVPVTTGIERWALRINSEAGQTMRTITGEDSIDRELLFDGLDDRGSVLPEGTYTGALEVLYENGNNPTAQSPAFTIDLTPPSATVSADLAIFSPDGDGNKDTVTVYQETSDEVLWTGLIEDIDGNSVRGYSWRGSADAKLQWDGLDDQGQLSPDGIYFYSLDATDRAGNRGESRRIRFELNTEATEVFLAVDLGTFSPNADGVKDTITISPKLKVTEGVSAFEFRVLNEAGQAVRSFRAQNRRPEDFVWDGLDNQGRRQPDGPYRAELILDYQKGDHHEVRTSAFRIDTQPPTVELTADYGLFSPDGDGLKDELPVRQSSSSEELWEGQFLNARGEVVRSLFWKGQAADFRWDGKDENGNKIPDGAYTYRISGTDAAGNKVSRELKGLTIDTRPTSAFLTVTGDGFSPNGDRIRDTIEFRPIVGLTAGIQSWTLEMVHEQAGVQKSFTGGPPVPERVVWDGRGDSGPAREGAYQAVLEVQYLKGDLPQAQSTPFKLDVSAPEVELAVSPKPFSPDNDGVDDELNIQIKVQDLTGVADWRMDIVDPAGHLFWSVSGKGAPTERIIWNGVSQTGELVQSAEDYTILMAIQDKLGNARKVEGKIPVDVLVIREGDRLKIRIASITFPANSADLAAVTELDKAARNDRTLARLFEIFNKYSSYRILIEGHANITRLWSQEEMDKENQEELIPLSLARAQAVKDALVRLGLDGSRISVSGLGGSNPIVPFTDEENRWKNRRVEFILIKK